MIGVLQVINAKKKKRFDTEDETFLQDLTSQVGIALENSLLIEEVLLSFNSSISTLSATVDARHPFTAGHSERVTEYSLLIARQMGLTENEIEVLKFAGLLHDIGKIGIRDNILLKNGQFTPEERNEMKSHPEKTKVILDKFRFPRSLRKVPEIAVHHHERIDGHGYPRGLTGDQLPLGSKILAVADVFDAITSLRDYPKYVDDEILSNDPMPLPKAVSILENGAGTQFDPEIVNAFIRCLPKALLLYRGKHFTEEYVDDMIRSLDPALLQ
jgi:putative nucleotidyltransferase with HDIG domain